MNVSNRNIIVWYDALVSRAIEIAKAGQFSVPDYDERDFARVSVAGDEATLSWPEVYEESSGMHTESSTFPARLLTATDSEIEAYKTERLAEVARKYEEKRKQNIEWQEQYDRMMYERLKNRFEGRQG